MSGNGQCPEVRAECQVRIVLLEEKLQQDRGDIREIRDEIRISNDKICGKLDLIGAGVQEQNIRLIKLEEERDNIKRRRWWMLGIISTAVAGILFALLKLIMPLVGGKL